jgi:hypothetical protein
MRLIPTRDPNDPNGIHPEIQQVVGLTLAHSSKVYCSGPLVRRIERNPDGTISKDARWIEVWAQLGGTTLSVWDMDAIKKASEEGRQEPPAYINVTDSVSIPYPHLKRKFSEHVLFSAARAGVRDCDECSYCDFSRTTA